MNRNGEELRPRSGSEPNARAKHRLLGKRGLQLAQDPCSTAGWVPAVEHNQFAEEAVMLWTVAVVLLVL